MKLPLQKTDLLFVQEIIKEFTKIKERFSSDNLSKKDIENEVAKVLGYDSFEILEAELEEYILPYQTELNSFLNFAKDRLFDFLPKESEEEIIDKLIKEKFLPLKSLNTLVWKFNKHKIEGELVYRVSISDLGKNISITTSTFVKAENIKEKMSDTEENVIINFNKKTVDDFIKIKTTLGYNKMHLTLSEGIDDMLAEILSSMTFEDSFIPLDDENFNFCESKNNTILLNLPALIRICGKDTDIYAYAFEKNENNTYFAVVLNEYYSENTEIYLGDIIEISGEHIELLTNPVLYRDLLIYHNSVEPNYTPDDLKKCFMAYCDEEKMKLFDIWYNKFIDKLYETDQNFYATKIMNHLTNLLLDEKLFKNKNLYLIDYNEEQYNKYKRNEISLNKESYKIRQLINNFLENFLKEKNITIHFIPFDEKDYFEFIKQEKLINNDDSKLKWLEAKYIGDKKEEKKLQDIGSFTLQKTNNDLN